MNIKKIGLSALAGSLAMVSANAVELAISGKTEVTYMKKDLTPTGNPFGMGNAITFSGSGDVNGMTATYTSVIQDGGTANSNTSEVFASSSLMLDMGDMGTIGFDQGIGEFGVDTIDDKMPYAYEEIWTYTGSTTSLKARGGSNQNVLGYKNTYAGYTLSLELDPGQGTALKGATGDGGATGAGTTVNGGYNWALTGSPSDGVNVGVGRGTEEHNDATGTDSSYTTGFVTYAMDAFTVGYQMSEGRGGTANTVATDTTLYGVSFSVNENLALSYNEMETEFDDVSLPSTEKTQGVGASYTMGSAALRIVTAEISNKGGASAATIKADDTITEISLLLAF